MLVLTSDSTKKYSDKFILAIGGGSIIDFAKRQAKLQKKYLIAIPTTGAGATETTHAVVWSTKKKNVRTSKPITVRPPFKVKLSPIDRRNTAYDILGHIVDYLNVCTDNEMIDVGIYAGGLIEQRKTNLTHPKSYKLTLDGIPHGEAVGRVLKESLEEAFPIKKKVNNADMRRLRQASDVQKGVRGDSKGIERWRNKKYWMDTPKDK